MAINPDQILAARIPTIEHHYDWKNCVLYALGLSVGFDPMDETDLPFVDESRLKVEPTMANVLGYPGFWPRDMKELGIDWVKTVHGEQAMRIHRPLPSEATVRGVSRVVDLVDKGKDKGALVYVERNVTEVASGELLATLYQTIFLRGDGGFGGSATGARPHAPPRALPDREPDLSLHMPTSPQSALVYRLSGDHNPLHMSPATARAAGFERPILHGLSFFGVAGHGLVKQLCDGDPTRLVAMGGRFSSPMFPGETVRLDIWRDGSTRAGFRVSVPARGAVVFNNGHAELAN